MTRWASRSASNPPLFRWAVTGESSAQQYVVFSRGHTLRIAVSNVSQAESLLSGVPESVPGFADLELLETDEPGYFFDALTDATGVRWASRLQTWLELQSGDATAGSRKRRETPGTRRVELMTYMTTQCGGSFNPYGARFQLVGNQIHLAGGYGLFLKQWWLLANRDYPTVIPLENWLDTAPCDERFGHCSGPCPAHADAEAQRVFFSG